MSEYDREERKWRAMLSPKWCVICGARSRGVARPGFSSCEEHLGEPRPLKPRYDWATGKEILSGEAFDHVAWRGHGRAVNVQDVLDQLTVDELIEQGKAQELRRQALLAQAPDGKPYGNRFAAYMESNRSSNVINTLRQREVVIIARDYLPEGGSAVCVVDRADESVPGTYLCPRHDGWRLLFWEDLRGV